MKHTIVFLHPGSKTEELNVFLDLLDKGFEIINTAHTDNYIVYVLRDYEQEHPDFTGEDPQNLL